MCSLSVLIYLVCFVTVPNGYISSVNIFSIVCLFIQIWSALIAVLNVMYVQIVILYGDIMGYFALSMVSINFNFFNFLPISTPWQQRVSLVWVSLTTKGFPGLVFPSNKGFP